MTDRSTAATAQPGSAKTLGTVVETVRRIMRADTASVAAFSLAEHTITWKALSGFRGREGEREIVLPLRGLAAEHAASADELLILEGVGVSDELPASEFPLHSAEGVRTVALAPLLTRGERLGALLVGFRSAHEFTAEERRTLEGLAEMAALALDNARLLETVSTAKRIWEQTFDAIPDGIIVHNAEMRLTRANAAAAEMLGCESPAEAIGLECGAAFARLFGVRAAAFHMTNRMGAASSFEIQAEDGRRHLVAVAPLDAVEGGAGWSVITWSDVTQLSEMQEQLSRSRRLVTVGQLAAGVAHEINNPLAAITMCAEATMRNIRSEPSLAAAALERNWNFYLEEIVRQALRCKLITRGLLDLARQRRARREPCDLNALVTHTVKLFEHSAAARGDGGRAEFELELDDAVGETATDESLVRQIVDNLLTNALDALGARGGRVTVSTAALGERVRVEVADTGSGVAPEMLARIFDPFFTTKEAGKGSGLGLAVATTHAEALGGALTVESKLGAGSRFRLWLPRRAPETRDEP
ncbi:MAG: GAF domain-containing protein [Acidobacteria bacterium]|nr:GAF domain-containing protein [Acidobacteriota bacterium]MCA1640939.1 GAF domain-containing protein [Acidobacteriota bacterium]